MVTLAIIFAILALILLLLATRVSATVQYDQSGVRVIGGFGLLRMRVYPKERKEKRPRREKKKKDKPDKEPHEKGGTVDKLKAGLSIIRPILAQVKRRLVISELTLHYTVHTSDAAMTALAYGGAHATVSQILPIIKGQFRVKREDVRIHACFIEPEDTVFVRVKLSISVWGALCLGLFVLKKVRESGLIGKKPAIQKGAV